MTTKAANMETVLATKTRGFRAKELADTVVADELKKANQSCQGRQQRVKDRQVDFAAAKKAIDKTRGRGQEAQGQVSGGRLIRFLITNRAAAVSGTAAALFVFWLGRFALRYRGRRGRLWQRLAAFAQQQPLRRWATPGIATNCCWPAALSLPGGCSRLREGDQDVSHLDRSTRVVWPTAPSWRMSGPVRCCWSAPAMMETCWA